MKVVCKCGNRVPPGELKALGGACRACTREAAEKVQRAAKAQHLEDMYARYANCYPFMISKYES